MRNPEKVLQFELVSDTNISVSTEHLPHIIHRIHCRGQHRSQQSGSRNMGILLLTLNSPTDAHPSTHTTTSKPSDYPSLLRSQKHSQVRVQSVTESDIQTTATTNEPCPRCGAPEVRYETKQLRSADEGSTVFFTCVGELGGCGYT